MAAVSRMSPARAQTLASPYWAARCDRVASSASAPRAVNATLAPSFRHASTMPSPMPRLPPATNTTLSFSCRSMGSPSGVGVGRGLPGLEADGGFVGGQDGVDGRVVGDERLGVGVGQQADAQARADGRAAGGGLADGVA